MHRRTLLSIRSSLSLISIALVQPALVAAQSTGIAFESETRVRDDYCAVGDLNRDGFDDLVSTLHGENALHVRFNDGHGQFPTVRSYPIPSFSQSLALADIDGDGNLDILAALSNPSGLMVLLNDAAGTGHFSPRFFPALASTSWARVVVGDINGDGRTDALLLDTMNSMAAVFPNSQGGPLAPIVFPLSLPPWPLGLALVDVDRDGDLDLMFDDSNHDRFGVCMNNGTFGLQPPTYFGCGFSAIDFASGDVDGDGYPDVLMRQDNFGGVQVFRNQGNGTFAPPSLLPSSSWPELTHFRVADVDGNGINDIVAGGHGALAVFHGLGGGAFSRPDLYPMNADPSSVDVARLDGDGWPDIVCGTYPGEGDYIKTFQSIGGGKFSSLPLVSTGASPESTQLVDIDGDGDLDMIALVNQGYLSVMRNRGDGTFEAPALYAATYPQSMTVGDVDGDGDQDVVIAANDGGPSVLVFVNPGNGVFASPLRFQASPNAASIALGDLDGDGRVDVVLGNRYGNVISILHQISPLQWVLDQTVQVTHSIQQLALADLDGDGDLDLIAGAGNTGTTGISVLTNLGQGSFSQPQTFVSPVIGQLGCADIDGDGLMDIVATYPFSNAVGVRINNGNGTWQAETQYPIGSNPFGLTFADVDGDSRVDVLVLEQGLTEISVLRNAGLGQLQFESAIPAGGIFGLVAGDLDGDGDVDLAVTNVWLSGVVIQRNLATNGSAFCPGDGSGSACPCGNQSASGSRSGCLNSLGLGGHLSGGGRPEIHADSVTLTSTQMRNGAALLLQSPGVAAGGAGTIFCDGLRCVGTPVMRVGVQHVTAGSAVFPAPGASGLAMAGGIQAPGDMHYQVWYRDPIAFCTTTTANLTNGWTVHWTP